MPTRISSAILKLEEMTSYRHSLCAGLLRRIGSSAEALVTNDSERRYLERRLREVLPVASA